MIRQRIGRLALAASALTAFLMPALVAPAVAHVGGRAQLWVSDLRMEPAGPGWTAHVLLTDYDSGKPAPGFAVTLSGMSAAGETLGPIELVDAESTGDYSANVNAAPGGWTFSVEARGIPGAVEAIPFTKSFPMTLSSGQGAVAAQHHPATEAQTGGGGFPWLALVIAGTVATGAAGAVVLARRARSTGSPEPERAAW